MFAQPANSSAFPLVARLGRSPAACIPLLTAIQDAHGWLQPELLQYVCDVTDITPAQMRDGMEALELTPARLVELGMPNFGPTFAVSS